MAKTLDHVLNEANEVMTVRRVFGMPVKKRGVTLVPVASVSGGGGGGEGQGPEEQGGSGGGFGAKARPLGAYVIRGDRVAWKPALDFMRLGTLAVVLVALVALAVGVTVRKAS